MKSWTSSICSSPAGPSHVARRSCREWFGALTTWLPLVYELYSTPQLQLRGQSQLPHPPHPRSSPPRLLAMASSSPSSSSPPARMPLPTSLRPLILDILAQSDLEAVTPRNLRGQLQNIQQSHKLSPPADTTRLIPADFDFEVNKKAVTNLIKECYDEVASRGQDVKPKVEETPEPPKPKPAAPSLNGGSGALGGLALPGLGGVRGDSASASASASTSTDSALAAQSAADAALAAKLQQQYSAPAGPSTRGANGASSSSSSKKRKKPRAKSGVKADPDEIDSQEDSDIDSAAATPEPGAKAAKRTKKAKSSSTRASNPNNPFNRPVLLDAAMADICGGDEMPRHAVVKQLWAYVKGRDLQNPANRRQIMCDDKLKNLFGKSVVDSFEMSKLISGHVRKKEDVLP